MDAAKPFAIPKRLVMEAFKAVKANAGAAGVDQQSIEDFEKDLKGHLYKLWNRMASGSYFPPPNKTLVAWAMRKYRRLKGHKTRASLFIEGIAKRRPELFVHWRRGMVGAFA